MAANYVQVPPNSTGLKVDTTELTSGANTVERQNIIIADPSTAAALAAVVNSAPGGSAYGLVTWNQPSGTQPISGTVTVNALPAGTNVIGHVIVDSGSVSIVPAASGGLSIYHAVSASSTNAASIKGSAGQLYGWSIFNNASYPVYVKLFNNTNSPPVPGTDTVFKTIGCQAGVSVEGSIPAGIAMGTGIGIAIVKGIADANSTTILASDCVVDIYYK